MDHTSRDRSAVSPVKVADDGCWTGEGPLWHPDERAVYWVDIPNGRLFRYDAVSGSHERCLECDGTLGGFTIQEDGNLLLFLDNGSVRPWNPSDGLGGAVVDENPTEPGSRFNDVIADPRGRVLCGSMPTENPRRGGGRLYRLDHDGSLTTLVEDVATPNGMGFSRDGEYLYFAETGADRIYRFEYDCTSGTLSSREVFVDASGETGSPDGMTVDAEGHVWSAYWNGGCLVRYTPEGVEERRIDFPARKVSSVTFGGARYHHAYVTTALGPAEGEPGTKPVEGEGAGALFRLQPGIGGTSEYRSRVGL